MYRSIDAPYPHFDWNSSFWNSMDILKIKITRGQRAFRLVSNNISLRSLTWYSCCLICSLRVYYRHNRVLLAWRLLGTMTSATTMKTLVVWHMCGVLQHCVAATVYFNSLGMMTYIWVSRFIIIGLDNGLLQTCYLNQRWVCFHLDSRNKFQWYFDLHANSNIAISENLYQSVTFKMYQHQCLEWHEGCNSDVITMAMTTPSTMMPTMPITMITTNMGREWWWRRWWRWRWRRWW